MAIVEWTFACRGNLRSQYLGRLSVQSGAIFSVTLLMASTNPSWAQQPTAQVATINNSQVVIVGSVQKSQIRGTGKIIVFGHGASVLSTTTNLTPDFGINAGSDAMSLNSGDVNATADFFNSTSVSDGRRKQDTLFAVQATGSVTTFLAESD